MTLVTSNSARRLPTGRRPASVLPVAGLVTGVAPAVMTVAVMSPVVGGCAALGRTWVRSSLESVIDWLLFELCFWFASRGRVSPRRATYFSLLRQRNVGKRKATLLSASLRFASGNLRCSRFAG